MIPNWVSGNLDTYSLQIRGSSHKNSVQRKDLLPSICESQCLRFITNTSPTACLCLYFTFFTNLDDITMLFLSGVRVLAI